METDNGIFGQMIGINAGGIGQSAASSIGISAAQNAYNHQLNAMAGHQGMISGALPRAAYPKKREQEEMRFTVDKVANGYVMRLAGGYGDLVSSGNTYIAADIKELGDLFISTVVNHQLDK